MFHHLQCHLIWLEWKNKSHIEMYCEKYLCEFCKFKVYFFVVQDIKLLSLKYIPFNAYFFRKIISFFTFAYNINLFRSIIQLFRKGCISEYSLGAKQIQCLHIEPNALTVIPNSKKFLWFLSWYEVQWWPLQEAVNSRAALNCPVTAQGSRATAVTPRQ